MGFFVLFHGGRAVAFVFAICFWISSRSVFLLFLGLLAEPGVSLSLCLFLFANCVCGCTCACDLAIWWCNAQMGYPLLECAVPAAVWLSPTDAQDHGPLIVEASAPWFCNPSDRL